MTNGFGGGVEIVGEFESTCEGVIGVGRLRGESDGLARFASGAGGIVRLGECRGEIRVSLRQRGLETNCSFELRDGRLDFSGVVEDPAEVVVRFSAAGIQADGGFELFASSGIVAALQSGKALFCRGGGAGRSAGLGGSRSGLGEDGKCGQEKGCERRTDLISESNARTEHRHDLRRVSFNSY